LTSKAQTTIPQSVRRALQLKPGDELEYQMIDDQVLLTKAHGGKKMHDPFHTFDEWSRASDDEAYADL
jgi:antitoxin PrlF